MEQKQVILRKEDFLKRALRFMLVNGQARRDLSTLISDLTNAKDWWPEGLPCLPCNWRYRETYIKQEWNRGTIRLGDHHYTTIIEDVLGLYFAISFKKH